MMPKSFVSNVYIVYVSAQTAASASGGLTNSDLVVGRISAKNVLGLFAQFVGVF